MNKHEIKGYLALILFAMMIVIMAMLPCRTKLHAEEQPKDATLEELIQAYHKDVKEAFFLAIDMIKQKQLEIIDQDKKIAELNGLLAEKTEELAKAKAQIRELDKEVHGWSKYFKSTAGFNFYHDKTFSVYLEERIFIFDPLWVGLEGRYCYGPSSFRGGLGIGVTF